jgi:CENP-S associating Centromere protein X
MPAERQQAIRKRKQLPFNPPRPRASATDITSPTSTSKSKSKAKARPSTTSLQKPTSKSTSSRQKSPSPPVSVSSASSGLRSGFGSASPRRGRELSPEPDYILAEIITNAQSHDVQTSDPAIPPKLLTKLLHHHFTSDKIKITKDANAVVAKYVDIFVREALARAAYERVGENFNSGDTVDGLGGGRGFGDGFLEVCSLIFTYIRALLMTGSLTIYRLKI